jgi:hypothetical protein
MTVTLLGDLAGFAGVFALSWGIYLAAHLLAASCRLIRGANYMTVGLATAAAIVAGAITSWSLEGWFSSPGVHALSSIAAPVTFLGYCGIYVLIGPVTVDRSISLSMLRALEASQHKKLKRNELQAEVPFDRIFEKRMRELELSGSIDTRSDVKITQSGARIIRLYMRFARMFNVDFQ